MFPLINSVISGTDYVIVDCDYIIAATDFIITATDYRISGDRSKNSTLSFFYSLSLPFISYLCRSFYKSNTFI